MAAHPLLLASLGAALLWGRQAPAPPPSHGGARAFPLPVALPSSRLVNEVRERQEALANVEYLADVIGGRMTGSYRLLKAHDWVEAKMKAYGLASVHREAYDFARPWTRGVEEGRLLSHSATPLRLAQMAWSPATPGPVRGEALLFTGTIDERLALVGSFKGRILVNLGLPRPQGDPAEFRAKMQKLSEAIKAEGPAALLVCSFMSDGKLMMAGSPQGSVRFPRMPSAFISREQGQQLVRLLKRHEKVELEVNLGGQLGPTPVQAYNSVGEIRGSERPDEVVILGAHLDSWDLAGGATDNGTGVAAVLEAMRALQASGLRPKRTIRAVFFSGEEQGLKGSEAYAKQHESELPGVQAVLVHDGGSGRVRGWSLQKREDLLPLVAQALATSNDLGVRELPLEANDDTDHAPFVERGVPAFSAVQDDLDYSEVTHHSQVDTFEHVKTEDLVQGAQALAVNAWELANLEARLPHRAPEAEAPAPAAPSPAKP